MRLTRVTLFFIVLILGLGFFRLIDYLLQDLEFQTLQATEESMVDTANILAGYVETGGSLAGLGEIFDNSYNRDIEALIFKKLKTNVGLNAYLTDDKGIILFDSGYPKNIGEDFSRFRDIRLTLAGKYGARSSRTDENDKNSSVMFVGAPVHKDGKIVGCLSVYKAQADVLPFVQERRRDIIFATIFIGSGIIILIGAVFIWLFRPIGQLTDYARSITRGERRSKPAVGLGREANTLANALHDMRESLEGRTHSDKYIQTLTHELKSPLAAIQGAAELMDEDMPAADRAHFLENICNQTARCERMIHRLLELSSLEAQTHLEHSHGFDIVTLCKKSIGQMTPLAEANDVTIKPDLPKHLPYKGNELLLGSALNHLLENTIHFSPKKGEVLLLLESHETEIILTVQDQGEGIPEFAAERAFERFFSYRPDDGTKGNGLGLAFVKEIANLHLGRVNIFTPKQGGTCAFIALPLIPENR